MNITYIHGFASNFDPTSQKVTALGELGQVTGHDHDYTLTFDALTRQMLAQVEADESDLVIGTSMGGFFAAVVGSRANLPFVAVNPATEPGISLQKYIGDGLDWTGKPYHLAAEALVTYPQFPRDKGHGLILLDMDDEVIDSNATLAALQDHYSVKTFDGGNHRFEHMQQSLEMIQAHVDAFTGA